MDACHALWMGLPEANKEVGMIEVTPEDIHKLAPELASVDPELTNEFIAIARSFINEERWGPLRGKKGIVALTAHMLTDLGYGPDGGTSKSASGPVTMEKEGDLQISYAQLSMQGSSISDQIFSTTKYGRIYIALKKTIPTTPLVV